MSNSHNKQALINMLCDKLKDNDIRCKNATDDADLLIALTAVDCALSSEVVVIGKDTDLLVLLIHHVNQQCKRVIFKSDKMAINKKMKIWNIQQTKEFLGEDVCNLLPFLHSLTGCDSTSRLFGIGKGLALKKLNQEYLKMQGKVFMNNNSIKADIIKAGEEALTCLYGGLPLEGLNILRWRKFTSRVITGNTSVQVKSLPPTSDSGQFHSLRVYHQCQKWMSEEVDMDPTDYGWEIKRGKLCPILMELPPAPDKLLNIIRCNCKQNCDTKRCVCRKNGLQCSVGCGECRGLNCSNSVPIAESDFTDE
ncbi:unnamed protein product [Mytilus coruscus]|uniref:Tesmin/TSO1-like CXC domain-containing protein n=1 Tax=Mytilus coruscus TaxID=42192 RepID=A0A6J8ARI2_MYTCO|nr:unnamed protein product [Mytilus coruscus]